MGPDQTRQCMRPRIGVVPGTLHGQSDDRRHVQVERTKVGGRRMETGDGPIECVGRDTRLQFPGDMAEFQRRQMAQLADDQHGMGLRIGGREPGIVPELGFGGHLCRRANELRIG